MPRNFVVFATQLPDDSVWNEHGDCVAPGGNSILQRLRAAIVQRGFVCTPVEQHSFYGWDFVASPRVGKSVMVLLQFAGDPWLLTLTNEQTFLQHLLGRLDHNVDASLLSATQEAIAIDPIFSNVRWLSETEYGDYHPRHNAGAAASC